MRKIQFDPSNESIFTYIDNNGYITIFNRSDNLEDNDIIYTSREAELIVDFISYSYNREYFAFIQSTENSKLTILPYDELIANNINMGGIFSFTLNGTILNCILSPNRNQVAIVFILNDRTYTDSINGQQEVAFENRNRYFIHVYDYTPGNSRLVFQRMFNNHIEISLSNTDLIAISTYNIDDGMIVQYHLYIYNLIDGTRILGTNIDISVSSIKYFFGETYSYLLIIGTNFDGLTEMNALDLVYYDTVATKTIGNNILSFDISTEGEIAIGLENGLLYFIAFDYNPILLNQGYRVESLAFSENNIGMRSINNNDDELTIGTQVFNLNYYRQQFLIANANEDEDEDEEELVIHDPKLDIDVPNQAPDLEKLKLHGNDTCMDLLELSEQNIGNYLSSSPDNVVLFYKNPSDAGFLATCSSFEQLKKFLKDPQHVFYSCVQGKDFRTYHRDPPQYVKIPTGTHTIFVNYQDIKQKYMQRQNMIFLEHEQKVTNTITYDASYTMAFISSNHCQDGSVIDVYRIIF